MSFLDPRLWAKQGVWVPGIAPVGGTEIPTSTTSSAEGRKDDTDKLPLHLIPFDAVEGIADILKFGAAKYEPRNWERGMAWSRPFGACLRHLWAWWRGEAADAETGKSHLLHAGCCILFLIAYEMRSVGQDDRPGDNSA